MMRLECRQQASGVSEVGVGNPSCPNKIANVDLDVVSGGSVPVGVDVLGEG